MKLSDLKETYEELSGTASSIVRQLAFAGIAIVWIYRIGGDDHIARVPKQLLLPILFLGTSLFLDLIQYAGGAIIYFVVFRLKEVSGTSPNTQFDGPLWPTYWNWTLWILKVMFVLIAYVLIGAYVLGKLFPDT